MQSALILLIAIASLFGVYFMGSFKPDAKQVSPQSQQQSEKPVYQDSELKFQFEYPPDFEVVNESEEQYSERTKTKYRKNFDYYVRYEPPKFVKGLVVKSKDVALTGDQFATVPFYLWVFENPKELSVEKWYKDFWYYPFFWGVFDVRKAQIEPSDEATVSGIMSKSAVVSYSPGKPKLILLPKGDKMFLFKIMENGDKILESFKFLFPKEAI